MSGFKKCCFVISVWGTKFAIFLSLEYTYKDNFYELGIICNFHTTRFEHSTGWSQIQIAVSHYFHCDMLQIQNKTANLDEMVSSLALMAQK